MRLTKDEKQLLIEAIQFLHDDALESANEQMGAHYYDEDAGVWTKAGTYDPHKMAYIFSVTGACKQVLNQVKTKPSLFSSPQNDHLEISEELFPMIAQSLTLFSTDYAIKKRAKAAQKEVQETDGVTPELETLKKHYRPNYSAFESLMKKLMR